MNRRRLLWSFLLALLLPLAQVAAAAHELSHVRSAIEAGSKSTPASAHCDICTVAAAIGGGAATSSAPAVPQGDAHAQSSSAPPAGAHGASAFFAFHSRAPPSFLR